MFVIFEQIRPAFRNYRRSPFFRILLIVVVVHLLLFVFTPPFYFQPYELAAQDTVTVVHIPVYEPPPPVEKEPPPPYDPEPIDDELAPEHDPFELPDDHEQLIRIRSAKAESAAPYFHREKEPVVTKLVRPVYPELAKQAGIEGIVYVQVTIGIDGKVCDARVISSDVTPAMNRAALDAAWKCVFEPAEQQNRKVRVSVVIPFEFRLTTTR